MSPGREAWRRFKRHRLAVICTVILAFIVLAVLLGPWLWRVPISDIDFSARMQPPSWAHPLGTDDLGQDLLARMLYGGRISRAVGLAAMLIAITVGVVVGAVAGMSKGPVDVFLMWLTDLFLSLPQLPLLLLIFYLFNDTLKKWVGTEMGVFILVVAVIGGLRWMPVARLVRAQFLSLREKEFVEAARALGASPWRQVTVHILPNAMGPVIVAATIDVDAITFDSGSSAIQADEAEDLADLGDLMQTLLDKNPREMFLIEGHTDERGEFLLQCVVFAAVAAHEVRRAAADAPQARSARHRARCRNRHHATFVLIVAG